MDSKLLIDSIVKQTTVLIAQLSTAAGVRAPLSHVADQVFVQLAQEIERQGVGRKVVADMFGLALRTYQRKVQRLAESATVRDKTLWEAVLEFLKDEPQNRQRIRERFHYDGEEHVGAVLNDLVSSGLVYCTGRGDSALFGLTSSEQQAQVAAGENSDALANMVWLKVFSSGEMSQLDLQAQFSATEDELQAAISTLLKDGRLQEVTPGVYHSSNLVLPLGAQQGWEAAVFNQFSAVAQTIAAKLRIGTRAEAADQTGGATYTFTVFDGHPHEQEILGLLSRMRSEMDELWDRVSAYNQQHAVPDGANRVCFYFGQNVRPANDELDSDPAAAPPPAASSEQAEEGT